MSQFTEFSNKVKGDFAGVNASLDNIVADEAELTKKIQDLKDQLAAGGSVLTPEDQAALDSVVAEASALSTRTKGVADSLPDVPVPQFNSKEPASLKEVDQRPFNALRQFDESVKQTNFDPRVRLDALEKEKLAPKPVVKQPVPPAVKQAPKQEVKQSPKQEVKQSNFDPYKDPGFKQK